MIVTLTWPEMLTAYQVSAQRRLMALQGKFKPRYGAPEFIGADEMDLFACRAEMAVAKGLNLYWSGGVGEFDVDVGGLVEVRSIARPGLSLIVHPKDKWWCPFVLVDASNPPHMKLVGWVFGSDAQDERFWSDPSNKNRPAYFVPQSELNPISELQSMLRNNLIVPQKAPQQSTSRESEDDGVLRL